jgi:hypothetical protein
MIGAIYCLHCLLVRPVRATTARRARRMVRAARWTTIRMGGQLRDLCPECSLKRRARKLVERATKQKERYVPTR